MTFDLLNQQVLALRDMYTSYLQLGDMQDPVSEKKKQQMRQYMSRLTQSIRKLIDEERQNVG